MKAVGYTMVELVVTLVIIGIVAAVAIPRFASKDTFQSRGFYDRATATVRYAQKLAIAQRRVVVVCVNSPAAGDISVAYAAGCASQLTDTSGVALKVSAPAGVTLSPTTNVSFMSGLGQVAAQVTITVTSSVPGDPARAIVVENETGYVHN